MAPLSLCSVFCLLLWCVVESMDVKGFNTVVQGGVGSTWALPVVPLGLPPAIFNMYKKN